ncbi:MAG: ribose 5-phosphate isomerase B [Prosthecochloris sp.]|uniref:Sugar-phosphate isomerase, RpiB/LacA/LacB family n=1 Tax=Prosthecochloris aestuarii (strain DSM 271 / SK 413) TaxID=290512 RepID=B4S7P4_PROA2|nr:MULTISPECIES: ribose 5-phosphate isomerase B [Prosthecochloris]ACF46081.1 sugar-phosphate isomerase, RpiB/LacA/LacB family [Prosthecochloris aestuarii DSM 271]MCW8798150.1 ribose 5-phosphate isomerase B [Prosthecochloris sp.]NEX11541.1 ribose 5-phosphate isomerase B [Prosthecochloris sp.]RDD30405.1 ribose 5-phosphate isomerase B [Prosthecochloris sp. ZM]
MRIAIGSDHAGYELKKTVKSWLEDHGHEVNDMGPYSDESVDYPDYARKVAQAVADGEYQQGVLLCGSGIGVSVSANKIRGIRAALAFNPEIASLARQHNNANIICFPARFTDADTIKTSLGNWFSAEFEGGRHERRVQKIEP